VTGESTIFQSFPPDISNSENSSISDELNAAQAEIIDTEIFARIMEDGSKLPSASARVSERQIVLDAAQNIQLKFELVRVRTILPVATYM
jgi:mediator of RNA polymerase II transcription subunit 17, fungi type